MSNRVAITGMGIISSIGMDLEENLNSLKNSRHGITKIKNIDTKLKDKILVGEIKKTNEELDSILNLPKNNSWSRTSMIGTIAALEAIKTAGIDVKEDADIGFINATTVGGMDMTERYFYDFIDDPENRRYIQSHDAGNNTHNICDYLGLNGFVTTISTACSSAANAIMLGARMISSGRLDRVIVGGTDALSKFTMNGFNTLMILSDTYNTPFDDNRKGLNLGEGAAYLVLESEASYKKRNKKPLAYVSGYANANDAFHQTASSEDGEGAFLAMKKAFEVAELSPKDIDYINVHGTATPNNDLSEGRAIINLYNGSDKVPQFSSTKPFTGHTLAAAASIEAVFSIFALQEGLIFPNLNFKEKMKEFDLTPVTELAHKEVNTILSNSFGFGGNCSSLIFTKSH
jgi:3-oxoacyl-(acyl-carrier-protein) synthase